MKMLITNLKTINAFVAEKTDDIVANFYNKLSILLLILLLSFALLTSIPFTMLNVFASEAWVRVLAIIGVLVYPLTACYAVHFISTAGHHLHTTLENRLTE